MNLFFRIVNECDNNIDYDIYDGDVFVANLEITYHSDYIFIRHIRVNDEFRRKGYGTAVMDYVLDYYGLPVRLCVNENLSAKNFWSEYFKEKRVVKERGSIYSILV